MLAFAMTCFRLEQTCGMARAGTIQTRRGAVETPFFLSVATRGAIKAAVSMEELAGSGAPVLLANTYHLHLRPGSELIRDQGGLHAFIGWDGPILTDSGGFQVFSIRRKKITDEGVMFRSHIDGEKVFLDAETSMQIQHNLGADIVMTFDECPPNVPHFHKVRRAVERTTDWAHRSLEAHQKLNKDVPKDQKPLLFGIIQGGCFPELRQKSLEDITSLNFDGFALGGLAVGESTHAMYEVLDYMTPLMPEAKPRYLMGVGTPANLLEAIGRGIDMFDCVMPLRNARHGKVFTSRGTLNIENAQHKHDPQVLDEVCDCPVCKKNAYSRAYLHYLGRVGEDLGKRLLTQHNLHFYHTLMKDARRHILAGDFQAWKKKTLRSMGYS